MATSQDYVTWTCGPQVEPRFVLHSLRGLRNEILASRMGSTHQTIYMPDVERIRIPLPARYQQRRIADFLDDETARIDALVVAKQRMAALLSQREERDRDDLTTGSGCDTGVPTMPSMGPGWRLLRNKNFLSEIVDPSQTGEEEMLSVSHLTGVTPRAEKNVTMFEAESTVGYKRVQPGDLVVNTLWAWMGAAGVSHHHGIVSPAYGVYRFHGELVDPDWFNMLIRSRRYIDEMTRYSRGVWSSRLRLYPGDFLRLRTPVPPPSHQLAAVRRFEARSSHRGALTSTLTRQVALLRERRQALITAAVTGELEI